MPERIQLSRAKGWRMPPNTIKVDRTTRWGNMFRPGLKYWNAEERKYLICEDVSQAVELFRLHIDVDMNAPSTLRAEDSALEISGGYGDANLHQPPIQKFLKGKNLACWCKPGAPCHADVLLEIANRDEART